MELNIAGKNIMNKKKISLLSINNNTRKSLKVKFQEVVDKAEEEVTLRVHHSTMRNNILLITLKVESNMLKKKAKEDTTIKKTKMIKVTLNKTTINTEGNLINTKISKVVTNRRRKAIEEKTLLSNKNLKRRKIR